MQFNELHSNNWNSEELNIFKSKILKFMRHTANSSLGCYNPMALRPLSGLRLGLGHLWEQMLKHSSKGILNPLCCCRYEVETTSLGALITLTKDRPY